MQSLLKLSSAVTNSPYNFGLCVICQVKKSENDISSTTTETGKKTFIDAINIRKTKVDPKYEFEYNRIELMLLWPEKEVIYHKSCKADFASSSMIARLKSPQPGSRAFTALCSELRMSAANGLVLQLSQVFERFKEFSAKFDETIPSSYLSRLSTFKEKVSSAVSNIYDFHQPTDRSIHERQMLLIPIKYRHTLTARAVAMDEIPKSVPQDQKDIKTMIIESALKSHYDLQDFKGVTNLNITEKRAKECIPDSLFTYLYVLFHGQKGVDYLNSSAFMNQTKDNIHEGDEGDCYDYSDIDDDSESDEDDDDDDCEEDNLEFEMKPSTQIARKRIVSIGQDIVYGVSKGKKLTPKHIGLGLTLHQKTRKKIMVNLFNKAGHCISYKQLLAIDTQLGEKTLESLDPSTGAVTPPIAIPASNNEHPIVHITADNIDLLTDSLDGKNTFHATQMVVFQRNGRSIENILEEIYIQKRRKLSLRVPDILNTIPEYDHDTNVEPVLDNLNLNWYTSDDLHSEDCVKKSNASDMSFVISRECQDNCERIGWTQFNKNTTSKNPPVTAAGFMPLILNPAHENDTLLLVLRRSISVADHLKLKYIVLTTDQQLFCKLQELKWLNEEFQKRIILKLGGLHISMNFLKAIGQHMEDSGLAEIWSESGVLSEGSISKVFSGKSYSKASRIHKLTYQALWRILLPPFRRYYESKGIELPASTTTPQQLIILLGNTTYQEALNDFLKDESNKNVNNAYWLSYIDLVSTFLMFTRSMRDAQWELCLCALKKMLPLFARYDHLNYFKWVIIYIADMMRLPPEIHNGFLAGDFVVKRAEAKFNQVDADHAQEWLVGTSKKSGGVVGITNNAQALQRWALSFHWRTVITQQVFTMFGISSTYNDKLHPARVKRDNKDEDLLFDTLNYFKVMSPDANPNILHHAATKDEATVEIQTSLLNAKTEGEKMVLEFIKKRLVPNDQGEIEESFNHKMTTVKALTMKNLYEAQSAEETSITSKAVSDMDTKIFKRLILAYEAGRTIDLKFILKHEFLPIPLSIAELNGNLRIGDENALINTILKDMKVPCLETLESDMKNAHYLLDGKELVDAIGKLSKGISFKDYANAFVNEFSKEASRFAVAEITFERYGKTLKAATSSTNSKSTRPIRRVIENENVPLPKNWKDFISMSENRSDLYKFLGEKLSTVNYGNTKVILSGAFSNGMEVFCTNSNLNVSHLQSSHEDTDTRLVFHLTNSNSDICVVRSNESNVFYLLIHFFDKMKCKELWLQRRTQKKFKYIPIHFIRDRMDDELTTNLLRFNAITGTQIVSFFNGKTKNAAWATFKKNSSLLSGLGEIPLSEDTKKSVESFLVRMYKVDEKSITTTDDARYVSFMNVTKNEKLPPTSDAAYFHIQRSNYQVALWNSADTPNTTILHPSESGWMCSKGIFKPIFMTLQPITDIFKNSLSCGCKAHCKNRMCTCLREGKSCTFLCTCTAPCCNSGFDNK